VVPTVERAVRMGFFCSIAMAGHVDQPVDMGPIDPIEKHAGIGGERFYIAPLAFGEQRIERERGFSRS